MQPQHIDIVRESWKHVVPIADLAADIFYDRLFEIDPDIRDLFSDTDLPAQKARLVQALAATVPKLGTADAVLHDLAAMGRRHAGYGVEPGHYRSVGEALLWTLEKGLGDRWNAEMCAAWTAAYALVAGQMQRGATTTGPTKQVHPMHA